MRYPDIGSPALPSPGPLRSARLVSRAANTCARFLRSNAGFAVLAALTSILIATAYFNTTREYPPGSILRVTLGIADQPFQSRILAYKAAWALAGFLSLDLYTVHYLLRALTVLAILYTLRSLAKTLGGRPLHLLVLFPWAVIFSFVSDYAYPTDFLEILAFSLMLLLTLRERWPWLVLVFGLAFLNRESAVLFVPFLVLYALAAKRKPPILLSLAAMAFLALCLRLFILPPGLESLSLAGHPSQLQRNIELFKSLPLVFNRSEGATARLFLWRILSYSGFLYVSLFIMKREIPSVLRRYLAAVWPFLMLVSALVGNLEETRIFYPLLPALILSGAVFLEKKARPGAMALVLTAAIISGFYVWNGPLPKKTSEFAVKAKAFSTGDVRHWKKTYKRFAPQEMTVRGGRIIIDLSEGGQKFQYLDACITVQPSPHAPELLTGRFFLAEGIDLVEPFWRSNEVFSSLGRNPVFELKNPGVQTGSLTRIIIRFGQDLAGSPLPVISWKGFTAPQSPPGRK